MDGTLQQNSNCTFTTSTTTEALMSNLDVAELAASLEKTSASLKRHIEDEANRRAAERGKTYAKAAEERNRDITAELRQARERVAELRTQLDLFEQRSRTHIWLENRLRDLARIARERDTGIPHDVLLQAMTDAQAAGRDSWERERGRRQQEAASV